MVLWVRKGQARFFTSPDLKRWKASGDFAGEGFYECPDLFELPLDGNRQNRKWILHDGAFTYWIGNFDGAAFTPEAGPLRGDLGTHFYAAQTWNNTNDRIVQIAWMRQGEYPDMPFTQQMTFPCELTLRTTPRGVRLCRLPVGEIAGLYLGEDVVRERTLKPGEELSVGGPGDCFDLEMELAMPADGVFALRIHDQEVVIADGKVKGLGAEAPLLPDGDGRLTLRLLLDRTSLELFANSGELSMSSCFLPQQLETQVRCRSERSAARIRSLKLRPLASAWK
jgi:levanase/fructan beta-fructosidase